MARYTVVHAIQAAEQKLLPVLSHAAASVARQIRGMEKLAKSDEEATPEAESGEIVAQINLDELSGTGEAMKDSMIMASTDAAILTLRAMNTPDASPLFGRASKAAVSWAGDHAAELVTEIDDATRDMLRDEIAEAIQAGTPRAALADKIASFYAFSEDRAKLIARTEIAFANGNGALEGYKTAKAAGVAVKKEWLLGENPCPICLANADAGAIEIEEQFPSGDLTSPAHPRCECTVSPVVGK